MDNHKLNRSDLRNITRLIKEHNIEDIRYVIKNPSSINEQPFDSIVKQSLSNFITHFGDQSTYEFNEMANDYNNMYGGKSKFQKFAGRAGKYALIGINQAPAIYGVASQFVPPDQKHFATLGKVIGTANQMTYGLSPQMQQRFAGLQQFGPQMPMQMPMQAPMQAPMQGQVYSQGFGQMPIPVPMQGPTQMQQPHICPSQAVCQQCQQCYQTKGQSGGSIRPASLGTETNTKTTQVGSTIIQEVFVTKRNASKDGPGKPTETKGPGKPADDKKPQQGADDKKPQQGADDKKPQQKQEQQVPIVNPITIGVNVGVRSQPYEPIESDYVFDNIRRFLNPDSMVRHQSHH